MKWDEQNWRGGSHSQFTAMYHQAHYKTGPSWILFALITLVKLIQRWKSSAPGGWAPSVTEAGDSGVLNLAASWLEHLTAWGAKPRGILDTGPTAELPYPLAGAELSRIPWVALNATTPSLSDWEGFMCWKSHLHFPVVSAPSKNWSLATHLASLLHPIPLAKAVSSF